MNDYTWSTKHSHSDNEETLEYYLGVEMDISWSFIGKNGNYAEILTDKGEKYWITACGDGDSCNHRVVFNELDK